MMDNFTHAKPVTIGSQLLHSGRITAADAERILNLQREEGLRFGEAAIKLGLVEEHEVQKLLAGHFDYPYLHPGEGGLSKDLVAAYDPFSAQVEKLRAIRTQLMLRWLDRETADVAIAILSPGHGEGRSWLAANLAIVFSQLGQRTLLVDADLRNPMQHKLFGLDNSTGLSTLLAKRIEVKPLSKVPRFRDLTVLTAGPIPPNPQELLCCTIFDQVLKHWLNQYEIILIDTSAASESADAQSVASKCAGTMLVARSNHTTVNALANVVEQVKQTSSELLGSVMLDFK